MLEEEAVKSLYESDPNQLVMVLKCGDESKNCIAVTPASGAVPETFLVISQNHLPVETPIAPRHLLLSATVIFVFPSESEKLESDARGFQVA